MAVHTKHPVAAPPAAPLRERTRHLLMRGWCVFLIFQQVASVGIVHAVGVLTASVIALISIVTTIALWMSMRPRINPRRLPWLICGYAVWTIASVLWSTWPIATVLTWLLLVATTFQGVFVAIMLTWKEIVRALASALAWVVCLSLVFEVWVAAFISGPILPGFVAPEKSYDPIVYWSRSNLFDGGRIQGILGNANLLAAVALLAMIVFLLLFAARPARRAMLLVWFSVAAFLFVRAQSATATLAALTAVCVLGATLLMRTARRPATRTIMYVGYAAGATIAAAALWLGRDAVVAALGRTTDLTGREAIWTAVLKRAVEHPVIGNGYSMPWFPYDPAFDGWIVDHGQTVLQAHNMWIDVFFQIGVVGLLIVAGVYGSLLWRAWFFAVDRPRWDLVDNRAYSSLTLLPTLTVTILLVIGLAESGPLLVWGWFIVVLFGTKLKQAPLIGVGPIEAALAIERGDAPKTADADVAP